MKNINENHNDLESVLKKHRTETTPEIPTMPIEKSIPNHAWVAHVGKNLIKRIQLEIGGVEYYDSDKDPFNTFWQ